MYRYRGETWVNKVEGHQRAPTTSSDAIGWYMKSDVMGWRRSVTPNGTRSPSGMRSREGSPVGAMASNHAYNYAGSPTGGRVSIYRTEHGPVPTPRNPSPHSRRSIEVSLYGADPLNVSDVLQWKDAKAFRRTEATPLHIDDQPNTIQPAVQSLDTEQNATFREGLRFPHIKKGNAASGDAANGPQRFANNRLAVVGNMDGHQTGVLTGTPVGGAPPSRGRSRYDQFKQVPMNSRGHSSGAKSMSPTRGRTPSTPNGNVNEKFFNFEYITPWKPYNEKKKTKPWTKLPWTKFTLYGQ